MEREASANDQDDFYNSLLVTVSSEEVTSSSAAAAAEAAITNTSTSDCLTQASASPDSLSHLSNNNNNNSNNSNSNSNNNSSNTHNTSSFYSAADQRNNEEEEHFHRLLHARSTKRAANSLLHKKILVITFILLVLSNILVAVKCLSFEYHHEPVEQLLMALTVLWVNIELFTIDALLANSNTSYDVYLRSIHFHPLQFNHQSKLTKCDLCNQRIEDESFECEQCDFDCCVNCYRRRCEMENNAELNKEEYNTNDNNNNNNNDKNKIKLKESCFESENREHAEEEDAIITGDRETDKLIESIDHVSETHNNHMNIKTKQNSVEMNMSDLTETHTNKRLLQENITANNNTTSESVNRTMGHSTRMPLEAKAEISPFYYIWRSFKFMWPYWRVLALSLICLSANELIRVLLPNIKGRVLDAIIATNWDYFWHYLKLFCAFSSVTLVLGSVRSFCTMLILRNLMMGLRSEMFNNLICQDIALYDVTTVGTLTSRMTNDVQAMILPIRTLLNSVLSNVITLMGAVAMCLTVSWRLAMISLTMVGPIMFLTTTYAKWSMRLNRGVWDAMAQANSTATEAFVNIRTIKALSTESVEQNKFTFAMQRALRKTLRDAVVNSGTYVATHLLDLSASAILLGFGGYMAITLPNALSVGQLVTFTLYAEMMNNAYRELNGVLNEFTQSAGAAERVLAMLDRTPCINPLCGIKLNEMKGEITFNQVTFAYPSRPESVILHHFTLHIPANSMTALVGRSGSGKSTLLHLLLRLYDPQEGSIHIDHVDLRHVHLTDFHHKCAIVAQDTELFNTTIHDNIAYGVKSCTRQEVMHAAKRANAHDFIMRFPEGYHTNVGERGVQLSGGQKQRIAIARALLRRPRLLLLDEATSALDAESESLVQAALDELIRDLHTANNNNNSNNSNNKSCTIIVIAHRLSTVMNANNIVVIDNGNVVEQGKHDELLQRKALYWQLVNKQLQGHVNTNGTNTVNSSE